MVVFTPVSVACSYKLSRYMRSRDRLLKITDLYQQNQDYRSQRLRKITLGLQTKRTRLQPRCGPLALLLQVKTSFFNYKLLTIYEYS